MLEVPLFETGRAALFAILKEATQARVRVLLPEYICASVTDTVTAAGLSFETYKLSPDLSPDIDDLVGLAGIKTQLIVLVVNYFGLLDIGQISGCVRDRIPGCFLIADLVQAPFCNLSIPGVDASFNSYRKAFPVPGGAMAMFPGVALHPLREQSGAMAYKVLGMLRKHYHRVGDETVTEESYLRELDAGELILNSKIEAFGATMEVRKALGSIDSVLSSVTRRTNASQLVSCLGNSGLVPQSVSAAVVGSQSVPLFVPILVPGRRDELRRRLRLSGLYMPAHWPKPPVIQPRGETASVWYSQELSLVVDQRYGVADMEHLANSVLEVLEGAC